MPGIKIVVNDNGNTVLIGENDEIIDLSPKIMGWLDVVSLSGSMLIFSGWAADVGNFNPAQQIFVFVGDKLMYSSPLGIKRQGVATNLACL